MWGDLSGRLSLSVSGRPPVSQGTGFDEEAALLGAGREFALMKTASGKVGLIRPPSCCSMDGPMWYMDDGATI